MAVDPITIATSVALLSNTTPELARVLARVLGNWTAQKIRRSITLRVVGKDNTMQFVGITPENVETLLKQLKESEPPLGETPVPASEELATDERKSIPAEPVEVMPVDAGHIEAVQTTERPNPEALQVALAQATLVRMHDRLGTELPRARARNRLAKRIRLFGSLAALTSNVGVLGAIGLGNGPASIIAAMIALLVSGLKTIEDYLIAGVTGKEPQRLQELVIETNRLWYEAGEVLEAFGRLEAAHAEPNAYPLTDANRVAKELIRLVPEMELTAD